MRNPRIVLSLSMAVAVLAANAAVVADDKSVQSDEALLLISGQKEFLRIEPILVTARIQSERFDRVPPGPDSD